MATKMKKTILREQRKEFWEQLQLVFPKGTPVKDNMSHFYDFEYEGLKLKVNVHVKDDICKDYNGNVAVSFNIGDFDHVSIYKSNKIKGKKPSIVQSGKSVLFAKNFELANRKNWPSAIVWICDVVLTLAHLNNAINEAKFIEES